jgi:hypothetical protein
MIVKSPNIQSASKLRQNLGKHISSILQEKRCPETAETLPIKKRLPHMRQPLG